MVQNDGEIAAHCDLELRVVGGRGDDGRAQQRSQVEVDPPGEVRPGVVTHALPVEVEGRVVVQAVDDELVGGAGRKSRWE